LKEENVKLKVKRKRGIQKESIIKRKEWEIGNEKTNKKRRKKIR